MRILKERTGTAMTIHGEAVMLSRYGEVYNVIDNLMHPNPGTEEDEYSEIERPVDWLMSNNLHIDVCKKWITNRVYKWLSESPNSGLDETVLSVMYSDLYKPCDATVNAIKEAMDMFKQDNAKHIETVLADDELPINRDIAKFINESFTRVRAGGKFNPEGANEIYFRISSHNFDWNEVITSFLWNTFKSIDQMPEKIWIGHDAETNPPEMVLFYGTPKEFQDMPNIPFV